MRIFAFLFGSVLAASAFAAEPWEGAWVYEPEHIKSCAADGAGDPFDVFGDIRGIIITRDPSRSGYWQSTPEDGEQTLQGREGAILGHNSEADPWECVIGKITSVNRLEAWILDVECGGEGYIWQGRTILMRTAQPGELAAYSLGGEAEDPTSAGVTQLYRCQSPQPAFAAGQEAELHMVISNEDAGALEGMELEWEQQPQPVHPLAIELHEADALPASQSSVTGDWLCRVINMPDTVYDWFQCRISDRQCLLFEKLTGSQRSTGCLYRDSLERFIFLGSWYNPEGNLTDPTLYDSSGTNEQNEVGVLSRIGENRLRVEFPAPHSTEPDGSNYEIMELKRP